ncbi:hypothetical protein RI129_002673 [Pyrocoelia pectoralis]|uniref:Venom serine protease 34 n=1 Tax=Pyrocoelia pectoralis TaxID=417401 RepID=A0AAN7ZTI3_9COLE
MAVVGIAHLIMPTSSAVDPSCDYYQDVSVGQRYYIYNHQYPNKYTAGTSCRWVGQTAPNAVIVLTCEDINLPPSRDCQQDRLIISKSGDTNFRDSHNYCGKGTLSTVSEGNRISIGLTAAWFSMGGRFLCTITAIQSSNPPGTTESPAKCDCGWRQQRRIVGGVPAGINEFPHMAGLVHLQKREISCGASIIASRYALSAAHCVLNETARTFGLLIGDHDVNTGEDTASAALYIIEELIRHPMYNLGSKENDISVIKTEKTIPFGGDIGPVCLPFRFSSVDFVEKTVLALGWGTTEFTGPRAKELQKVNLTIVSNSKCQEELLNAKIFSSVLCTYGDGKDACQYDSGGPLLWYDSDTNRLQQVGVISYGIGCGGGFPAVNTRVTSFLAWIISVTSDADYCIK